MSVHGTLVACFSCCCFHHMSLIRAGPAARLVLDTLEIQSSLWKMFISWSVADLFDKLYGILFFLVLSVGVFMWARVKVLDCCNSVDVISPAGPWMANAECAQDSTGLIDWKLSGHCLGKLNWWSWCSTFRGCWGTEQPWRLPREWSQPKAAIAQGMLGQWSQAQRGVLGSLCIGSSWTC